MKYYCAAFIKPAYYDGIGRGVEVVEAEMNGRCRQDLARSSATGNVYFTKSFYRRHTGYPESCFEPMTNEQVFTSRDKAIEWLNDACI